MNKDLNFEKEKEKITKQNKVKFCCILVDNFY